MQLSLDLQGLASPPPRVWAALGPQEREAVVAVLARLIAKAAAGIEREEAHE